MTQPLDTNRIDITVAGLKSLSSVIPLVGGAVAEIVGHVIPGQRLDRACAFLAEVDQRLQQLELSRDVTKSEPFIDLFEDAVLQSLKALGPERTGFLASFVANSAKAGEEFYDVDKRLLQILAQLTDTDIEILHAHRDLSHVRLRENFQYDSVAYGPYQAMSDDEKNAYDAKRLAWDMHVAALTRFGLLVPQGKTLGAQRGTFDVDRETGLPTVTGHRTSALGRLLLRRIGHHVAGGGAFTETPE